MSLPHQKLGEAPQTEKSLRSKRQTSVAGVQKVSEGKRQIIYGSMAREQIWILFLRASSQYFLLVAQ